MKKDIYKIKKQYFEVVAKYRKLAENIVDALKILLDEAHVVGKQYSILALPTSYIIDPEGRVFKEVVGPMDEAMMEDLISELKS